MDYSALYYLIIYNSFFTPEIKQYYFDYIQ